MYTYTLISLCNIHTHICVAYKHIYTFLIILSRLTSAITFERKNKSKHDGGVELLKSYNLIYREEFKRIVSNLRWLFESCRFKRETQETR